VGIRVGREREGEGCKKKQKVTENISINIQYFQIFVNVRNPCTPIPV
jgi:hypothetical protein